MLYMELSDRSAGVGSSDAVMASVSDTQQYGESSKGKSKASSVEVQEDEIDILLRREDGKIYRKRDEHM